jgi:enoyl-CoA hydratase/carnithine racemase
MAYEQIEYSTKGSVGYLTLNNPSKINALSKLMISEIIQALSDIAADEAIKVLVIRAAGKHFCAGHYLAEMVNGNVSEYKNIFDQCNRMMQMIHDIPQPVLAQVQGIATAAGCQMVAWCDLAVAAEDAKFATPGVKIGLFCTTPSVAVVRSGHGDATNRALFPGP